MNTYKAFWNRKQLEVKANTAYEAQQVAAEQFGKRCKRWDVTVVVLAIGDREVIHSTNEF